LECSLPARECSDGSFRVCEVDERGCFVWSASAPCPGAECADTQHCGYHVGGIVSGLSGTVKLSLNGAEPLEVSTNGSFYFSSLLLDTDAYAVSVFGQPPSQQCSVLNSAGRVAGANVSTIRVLCEGFPLGSFGAPVYFKASNTGSSDRFGQALAMSGNTLAVGAPSEDSTGSGSSARAPGAVYVFERGPSGWSQQAFLKASNVLVAERFGWSVALNGDVLAVGAVRESSASRGINGSQGGAGGLRSGAVYVFVRQGQHWTQQVYIKASNADGDDWFGQSVALSGMGRWFSDEDSEDVLVVGADGEDSSSREVQSDNNLSRAGAAYVFVREGTAWRQAAYLKADTPTKDSQFGAAVAVSGDTVVVGEPRSAVGAVHVFKRSAGTWRESVRLEAAHPGEGDGFGGALTLAGDLLAVGAPGEDSAARGIDGDPSSDGAPESGAVYIFTRQQGGFQPTAYLKASNASEGHGFGTSVDLSGPLLVVGANGEGSGSTGVDGNQADQSVPGAGAAYVFALEAKVWVQRHYLKATNPDAVDSFGASVAVGAAGIAVGAPLEDSNSLGINGAQGNDVLSDLAFDSGAVYVFPQ
jgi:trimeric autotransporter adhesin